MNALKEAILPQALALSVGGRPYSLPLPRTCCSPYATILYGFDTFEMKPVPYSTWNSRRAAREARCTMSGVDETARRSIACYAIAAPGHA